MVRHSKSLMSPTAGSAAFHTMCTFSYFLLILLQTIPCTHQRPPGHQFISDLHSSMLCLERVPKPWSSALVTRESSHTALQRETVHNRTVEQDVWPVLPTMNSVAFHCRFPVLTPILSKESILFSRFSLKSVSLSQVSSTLRSTKDATWVRGWGGRGTGRLT